MTDLVPLAIAGLSMPKLGQALTGRQWFDTAIGMLGVGVVSADVLDVGDAPLFAHVLPVLGMVSFAFATVLQKRVRRTQVPIHQRLSLQCLAAVGLFAVCGVVESGIVPPLTAASAFGWLVLFATFGAWGVYCLCLRR